MTYSVVARDEESGCLGVAVQSGILAIGTRVPAVRSGVGAVAVQAGSRLQWRAVLLDLMARGLTAGEAVAALATAPHTAEAQFAAVGTTGQAVAFTGDRCIPAAGHTSRGPLSAQANTVASATTWDAMADAYHATAGPLAERMVAALAAAEHEGGDARGPQSAALLVVGPERGALATGLHDDPVIDLRVDDARDPVGELARLLTVLRAQRHLIAVATADDPAGELRAAVAGAPDDLACLRAAGIRLALLGHLDEALPLLDRAVELEPRVIDWIVASAERATAEGNPHAAALFRWQQRA